MNPHSEAQLQTSSNHPALQEHPAKLFVETTSRCNLSCFMCVKQTGEGCVEEGDLTPELFSFLEPAFPHLEALILNGVGEPLLNPQLEGFIRRGKELMPEKGWVGFQTNGLLLDHDRALSLTAAGLDRICLSVDTVSPDTFRRVREGGELSAVETAFSALGAARTRSGGPDLQVGVEFVLMRHNLQELPAAIAWAANRGATFAIVTHLLPYDQKHASQRAYDTCTDAAIELFDIWQKKAKSEGVNILRYFEVVWKYSKTPEEKRIVHFVEKMKTEAEKRHTVLDLKKLIGLDRALPDEVATVFDRAWDVAEKTGLDLRLPEIVPKEDRTCHFIEDGGAFVSWDGGVHPCYFLWHSYSCFASGWTQFVKPKVFGNLADRGIHEIWNDGAFRSFRESVLTYDYPYCASCKVAPCDYVQTDAFEHDCHIKGEPCGSCLWCMGLFQCLR